MGTRLTWITCVAAALAVCAAAACSATNTKFGNGQGAGDAASGQGGSAADGLFTTSGQGGDGAVLTLEPKTVTIEVTDGASLPVLFTAKQSGNQVFPSQWYVDRGDIAGVDAKGVLTATNAKGGEVKVFAKLGAQVASALATVVFKKTDAGTISADEQQKLLAASGSDAGITWAYPYDGTVWPRGLLAPELMWNGGGAGDSYLVAFSSKFLDVKVFTKAPPPSDVQLSQPDWVAVNESGNGSSVEVKVSRLAAGAPSAKVVVDHHWTMAKGSMRGSVYYWVNSIGRVVRLKPGQPQPDDFLAAAGVTGCSTCHAVSANGQTLIIGGDVNVSKFDLLANKPVFAVTSVGKQIRNWAQPAISPDGKFLVENNAPLPGPPGGTDGMFFADTGQKVGSSGLEGVKLWMPAFAPKGHKLAFVGAAGSHDLGVYPFDLMNGKVSAPQTLVSAGGDPQLVQICFPSMSPTVQLNENDPGKTWIVYHRGTTSSLDTRFGPGDLYLASADMPGLEVRLSRANGDGYPFAAGARDLHFNYEPTFAPQPSGGYMWAVFTSRRTYGNKLTGGSGSVKQLWMTAIDLSPEANKDPSHPAFWVRGQDSTQLNMRAYWALDPCIQKGQACKQDSDCCDGEPCLNGQCGGPKACAEIGQFCEKNADCCDPMAKCLQNSCDYDAAK